jgi:hypothetical protein
MRLSACVRAFFHSAPKQVFRPTRETRIDGYLIQLERSCVLASAGRRLNNSNLDFQLGIYPDFFG